MLLAWMSICQSEETPTKLRVPKHPKLFIRNLHTQLSSGEITFLCRDLRDGDHFQSNGVYAGESTVESLQPVRHHR